MINKYAIPNKYGFSRYRNIANFEFTEYLNNAIDEPKNSLAEFSEGQKDVILTFFGYTMAYALYLNQKAEPENAEADEYARFEAYQLYKELMKEDNFLYHISFSLGKYGEEEKEPLRIKSTYTLRKLLKVIEPIIKEQADKEKARNGDRRNSNRKKILVSLVPLFLFLENETHFKDMQKNDIALWILKTIEPIIIDKYENLHIDSTNCTDILTNYRREYKDFKYQMELV